MRYRKRGKAAGRVLAMSVLAVACLSLLAVLALSRVLVVRDIMVVGNRTLSREAVIDQSGVQPGDKLLSITAHKLRERLEGNRYIEYLGHDFDYRGTLTLRINERLGMAVVNVLGLYYVLDDSGMVLDRAGSEYPLEVAGPRVNGFILDENSRVIVGESLPVRDPGQLADMKAVLDELDAVGMLASISEMNVETPNNLFLMTSDGAKLELGDSTRLRLKLLIAREVLALRESEGDVQGARIDVSSGENAHYIPAILPTPTPVPTATPTVSPEPTPEP